MSKETDNNEIDNEWGISDIEEAGKSLTDNPPTMEDSATKAFGGQMPVKDVTADLTNVISSQIIVDAVKNSTVAEEYIEDYAVDGELFTEDYINEGLEEALGEYEEDPEYYDEEELPYEEEGYYQEPEPYIPVSKPKNSNNVPKPKKNRVVEDDEDDEEEDDNKDKLLLIGSIVVFILVVILGIVLILKLHGNDKKPVVPDTEIGTETDIDDITSNMNISVDTGEADKPDENPAPAEPEQTECEKNGHKYKDATCVEPKICEVCGKKDGKALGHDFATADCTKPTTCKRCGKEGTDTLGHKFKDATCESPKTCERCGVTEGEKLPHEFEDATCQKPKTCKLCGLTEGEKAEHVFVEESKTATGDGTTIVYKCSVCNETKTETTMSPEQKISKVISLINEKRKANNLPELTTTPELTAAANTRAQEIATKFDHKRPNGDDYSTVLPEGLNHWGENIAAGQATPEEVVDSWMSSEGHKNNIMNGEFKHMAIGYYDSGSGYTYYWVQLFTD